MILNFKLLKCLNVIIGVLILQTTCKLFGHKFIHGDTALNHTILLAFEKCLPKYLPK